MFNKIRPDATGLQNPAKQEHDKFYQVADHGKHPASESESTSDVKPIPTIPFVQISRSTRQVSHPLSLA